MNVDQRPLPAAASGAHKVLCGQAALSALAWLIPNAGVAVFVLAYGIPDDGSAAYLLYPVVLSLPALLTAVCALLLAVRLPGGRRAAHTGAVVFEALWAVLGTVAVIGGLRLPFGGPAPVLLLLLLSVLAAAYALAALLTPQARAHFR